LIGEHTIVAFFLSVANHGEAFIADTPNECAIWVLLIVIINIIIVYVVVVVVYICVRGEERDIDLFFGWKAGKLARAGDMASGMTTKQVFVVIIILLRFWILFIYLDDLLLMMFVNLS
jgi:hypothetical protein